MDILLAVPSTKLTPAYATAGHLHGDYNELFLTKCVCTSYTAANYAHSASHLITNDTLFAIHICVTEMSSYFLHLTTDTSPPVGMATQH